MKTREREKYTLRPFIEWRRRDWGIVFCIAIERIDNLDHDDATTWFPNIWFQLGPIVTGIAVTF
jgi:hypothetical protein